MQLAQGVIILVHEGRFALVKDDGRVMPFLLAISSRYVLCNDQLSGTLSMQ
jgi:hypothetical protein